jgi:hypothetical protein
MSRKLNPVSYALALVFLLAASSASLAQVERLGAHRARVEVQARAATLGCCKCLGGTNTLDLSTVSSNAWTVNNGAPVAFLTSIHPAWNVNPGPAAWVSTVATGASGVATGDYFYRLNFIVPECTIGQDVTLKGNVGGDDDFDVYLDNTSGAPMTSCAGWCFNTPKNTLHTFTNTGAILPGPHALIVKIHNDGGPSGMFVNATLTGACRRE